jgi:hypothetical protein
MRRVTARTATTLATRVGDTNLFPPTHPTPPVSAANRALSFRENSNSNEDNKGFPTPTHYATAVRQGSTN